MFDGSFAQIVTDAYWKGEPLFVFMSRCVFQ